MLVAALASVPPAGAASDECSFVPEIGLACRDPAGWRVSLRDGSSVLTHGIDPPEGHMGFTIPPGTPTPPACVSATERHGEVVYVRPADRPDRHATVLPDIRAMIAHVNGFLRLEASGRTLDYVMLCDPSGEVAVANVVLSTVEAATTFSSVMSDLRSAGYDSPLVKYWIWYDRSTIGGGIGTIRSDSELSPTNANLTGPSYGMTYARTLAQGGAWVMMHENAHNLGAVQNDSPNGSGGFHCNDGVDVMCYADGGSRSDYDPAVCSEPQLDCNGDDYFNVAPAPDTYAATAWNLGLPLNGYLKGCGAATGQVALGLGGLAVEGVSARTIDFAGCDGARYALSPVAATGTLASLRDLDICWLSGDVPLRCDASPGFELGVVPTGTTRAQVVLRAGAGAEFSLTAF